MDDLNDCLGTVLELHEKALADFTLGALTYTPRNLTLITPPLADPVTVRTLSGLVDMVGALALTDVLLHVADPDTVRALRAGTDVAGQRQCFIVCERLKDTNPFAFGRFYSPEEFAIALQSKFVQTPDLEALRVLASNVKQEAVTINEDDGYSQKVSASAGVALRSNVTAKPRVDLAPFRTFPEVEQPVSAFLFRAKGGGPDKFPELALFEADGGKWRGEAMENISRALRVALGNKELPIVS